MHFPKPVVLLLGGLLTVTGIGCSAASALFTDMRPAPTVQKSSSERMLAIGRMFEEQGRLDRAEAMYRGAVKKNPRDQAARESLANVQSRRKSPQVGGDILAAQPAKKQTPATPVSSISPLTQNKPHASGAKTPAIIPQPASSIPQTSAAQATPAAPAGQQQPAPIQPQPIPAATPASSASSFEQKPLSAASATASQSATSPTVHPASHCRTIRCRWGCCTTSRHRPCLETNTRCDVVGGFILSPAGNTQSSANVGSFRS